MWKRALVMVVAASLVVACGYKDDLYLPADDPDAVDSQAVQAAATDD